MKDSIAILFALLIMGFFVFDIAVALRQAIIATKDHNLMLQIRAREINRQKQSDSLKVALQVRGSGTGKIFRYSYLMDTAMNAKLRDSQ